jgi:hypothetical protein
MLARKLRTSESLNLIMKPITSVKYSIFFLSFVYLMAGQSLRAMGFPSVLRDPLDLSCLLLLCRLSLCATSSFLFVTIIISEAVLAYAFC